MRTTDLQTQKINVAEISSIYITGTLLKRKVIKESSTINNNNNMSNTNQEYELALQDDNGNNYPEKQISFLWENFSDKDGRKRLPKIGELDDDNKPIPGKEGAKLVISFINGDPNKPIILGCLENLAAQNTFHPAMGTNLDARNSEIDNNYNDDFRVTRTVGPQGDMIIELENLNKKPIKYHLNVKGNNSEIYLNSEGNTYIGNDNNLIQFDGNKIFIGSRDYSDKADEVGINAKRVILGNSTFYNPALGKHETEVDFPIDENTEATDFPSSLADNSNPPQHQWAVMGETLVYLLNRLIYWWQNTKYMSGNTVCKVAVDDYNHMKTEVLDKLPLILSSSISLINKSDDPKSAN